MSYIDTYVRKFLIIVLGYGGAFRARAKQAFREGAESLSGALVCRELELKELGEKQMLIR